ncbi:MAG: group I truncated hemoglobin [Thiobacillus sp.]
MKIQLACGLVLAALLVLPVTPTLADTTGDSAPLKRCCNGDTGPYKDFGEKAGIERLMRDFMEGLLADPRTRPFFEGRDKERIILQLTDQLCYALEGPCEYTGRPMRATHQDMGVSRREFNALVEVLQTSMNKAGIPFRSQNRVLAVFAPMERDIVTK